MFNVLDDTTFLSFSLLTQNERLVNLNSKLKEGIIMHKKRQLDKRTDGLVLRANPFFCSPCNNLESFTEKVVVCVCVCV